MLEPSSFVPHRQPKRFVRRIQQALLGFGIACALAVPLALGVAQIGTHPFVSMLMSVLPACLIGLGLLEAYDLAYRWQGTRSILRPQVAVIGEGSAADDLAARLSRTGSGSLLGVFGPGSGMAGDGADSALMRAIGLGSVDRVAVVLPSSDEQAVARLVDRLSPLAVDICIFDSDAIGMADESAVVEPARVIRSPLSGWRMVAKDIEDRVLGLLLLVLCAPVMLVIAALVRLTSPGPALFRQMRHGFRGQEVMVYKFRTMRTDMTDHGGRTQTRRGDPRITRLGRFLRNSSLDELPQLLNVIRGEMSIVGPRPHPVDMRTEGLLCRQIVEDYDSRHRVRPGITGWAQINGYRGATTTREQVEGRLRLDNHYIENWSLLFDFRIILLTMVRIIDDKNAF